MDYRRPVRCVLSECSVAKRSVAVKKCAKLSMFRMALLASLGWGTLMLNAPSAFSQEKSQPGILRFLQLKQQKPATEDKAAAAEKPAAAAKPAAKPAPAVFNGGNIPLPVNRGAVAAAPSNLPNPPPAQYNPSLPTVPINAVAVATPNAPPGAGVVATAYQGGNQQPTNQPYYWVPVAGPPGANSMAVSRSQVAGSSYQESSEKEVMNAIQGEPTPADPANQPQSAPTLQELPAPEAEGRPLSLSSPNDGQRIISMYADSEMYEEAQAEEIEGSLEEQSISDGEAATVADPSQEEYYEMGLLGATCHQGAVWCSAAGIVGGVQGTFLAPSKDSLLSVKMIDIVDGTTLYEESDFGFGGGTRTWLGLQAENVGFRAVYWGYENSNYNPDENVNAIATAGFANNYYLGANTFDLEMFNTYCFGMSTVRASLGARYADMERQAMILGRGKVGDVGLLGLASTKSELEGWGVVAGLEGTYPLRPWFRDPSCGPGPCHFFWKVQGAGLTADTKAVAVTQVHAVPTTDLFATAYSRDEAWAAGESTILTGLLQLGLDYRIAISRCYRPAYVDLMCAFEAQSWQTGEAAATSTSNAFLAGLYNGRAFGGGVEAKSNTNPNDIALYGFVFGVSLNY